jgi:putative acyl-CoA dehydrogenase
MARVEERPAATTHEVINQASALEGYNTFSADRVLVAALRREGGEWAADRAAEAGAFGGSARAQRWGREANENPPRLRTHDRFGNRIDEVEFHPAWHELLGTAVGFGLHSLPWEEPQPGAHVARAAMFMAFSHAEAGVGCPISMTYSVIPAIRKQPEVAAEWEPRFLSRSYDGEWLRPAPDKAGALCGMGMTEKQGGSDVRANTTVATPLNGGGPGGEYELSGHKWFMSAPMCDAFLVLAQTAGGLSCFLLPRFTPDGERNRIQIQRLKDKLGNRSNASSEIELRGAYARMVGQPGRGVPTIIQMVNHTRLDCVIGATAGMRAAVAQATWHAAHRSAFGARLADQPAMANVLADLAIEAEAATATAMRLARAYDEAAHDQRAEVFKRLATAVAKYHVCKRVPPHAAEALECLGGNGYVEASGMPRLYREAPLGSIWEGSGNVMALDVLRALHATPAALDVFLDEVDAAAGADRRLDAFTARLRADVGDGDDLEHRARRIVEDMAVALEASLLVRCAPPAVADAFCAARLDGAGRGLAYGTLPAGTGTGAIVARHTPPADR